MSDHHDGRHGSSDHAERHDAHGIQHAAGHHDHHDEERHHTEGGKNKSATDQQPRAAHAAGAEDSGRQPGRVSEPEPKVVYAAAPPGMAYAAQHAGPAQENSPQMVYVVAPPPQPGVPYGMQAPAAYPPPYPPAYPPSYPPVGYAPAGYGPQFAPPPPQPYPHSSHHHASPEHVGKHEMYGPGGMSELVEEISNGGNGLSSISKMLNLDDQEFWKGAIIGAAAVMLLTNDTVQKTLFRTTVRAKDTIQDGVDKIKRTARAQKEKFQDKSQDDIADDKR